MHLKLYLIALPIFVVLDALWLGLIAKDFYSKYIGFLMKSNINFVAAIIFYLLFVFGIVIFVLSPSLKEKILANGFGFWRSFWVYLLCHI